MGGDRPQAGFSLMEILIGSVAFLVVLGGVYVLHDTSLESFARGRDRAGLQQTARPALDRMVQELRMAGYAAAKLADPLVIATNDTVSIHADTDGAGPLYITYSLRDCSGAVGTVLYRQASATSFCGGTPIADGVAALQFTYFEAQNVPLPYPTPAPPAYQLDGQGHIAGSGSPTAPAVGSQRDQVRQIKVQLTLTNGNVLRPQRFTATSHVTLRNLIP
jgi:hypothetical protein